MTGSGELPAAEELQREQLDLDALARRAGWIVGGGVSLLLTGAFAAGMVAGLWLGGGR